MVNPGKLFESRFKAVIETFDALGRDIQRLWVYRPSDFGGGQTARFTNHSLCDFIVYDKKEGLLYLLELKSTKSTSISCPSYKQHLEIEALKQQEEKEINKEKKKEIKKQLKELIKKANSHDIKYHQIQNLLSCNDKTIDTIYNIKAYFIINFRNIDKTYMIKPQDLVNALINNNKSSVNPKDIMDYGGLEIPQIQLSNTKKYTYDVNIIFGGK